MLACVSSLENVESYKNVRDRKRWLTTGEAESYIKDNCPILSLIISKSDRWPDDIMYSWANTKSSYCRLVVERVMDNGRRRVNFWDSEVIRKEEQRIKEDFETKPGWCLSYHYELRRAYRHYIEEKNKVRGAFYDPEWFT